MCTTNGDAPRTTGESTRCMAPFARTVYRSVLIISCRMLVCDSLLCQTKCIARIGEEVPLILPSRMDFRNQTFGQICPPLLLGTPSRSSARNVSADYPQPSCSLTSLQSALLIQHSGVSPTMIQTMLASLQFSAQISHTTTNESLVC